MNVLVIINLNFTKVVDTISNFFSGIFNEFVGINNLQIVQQMEIMNVVIVLELENKINVITSFHVLFSRFYQTYLMKLFQIKFKGKGGSIIRYYLSLTQSIQNLLYQLQFAWLHERPCVRDRVNILCIPSWLPFFLEQTYSFGFIISRTNRSHIVILSVRHIVWFIGY